jgi:uncharacterized protein YegL
MAITNKFLEAIPRKILPVFFLVDTSGGMHGTKMGAVNSAIEQTLEKLREMNADNADAEIEVAFLVFSNGAKWLTPNGPMKVDNYYWIDLEADGLSMMGEAFRELNEKLNSSNGFMQRASGSFAPIIFLLSDGEATDDWKYHLETLYRNSGFFRQGIKVALAVGNDVDESMLSEFTGNKENVIRVPDGKNSGEILAKMVQYIGLHGEAASCAWCNRCRKYYPYQGKCSCDIIQNAFDDEVWDIDISSGGFEWNNKGENMALTNIERASVPRKTLALFFIIGTSGSMHGTRIGAVNSAIEQTLEKLHEMNADNADAEIEVAFLEYSSGVKWLTPNGPMKVDNYYWSDLDAAGEHAMGEAFSQLNAKLSTRSGFLSRPSGMFAPVLFLLSDSEPTDDYRTPLVKLQNNGWFKAAIKVALAIGDDANDSVLQEFTGSREGVVRVPDGKNAGDKLAKMVQFIAVRSSQVVSGYTSVEEENELKQAELSEITEPIDSDDVLETLVALKNSHGADIFRNPNEFYKLFNDSIQSSATNKAMARLLRDVIDEFDAFTVLNEARRVDEVLISKICGQLLIDKKHAERAIAYLSHVAGYRDF